MTTLPSVKSKRAPPVKLCAPGTIHIVARRKGAVLNKKPAKLQGGDVKCLFVPHSSQMKALLEKSRQSVKEGKGLTHEAFWKAVKARRGKAK